MVPVTFPLQNRYRWSRENDRTSTVAGIYALRQLQFKRSGRLDLKAVLALDCCSIVIGSDSDRCDSFILKTGTPVIQNSLKRLSIPVCQLRAKKCHTGHTNYFGIITRKAACHCEVASEKQIVLWTFAAKQPAVAGTDDSDHPTVIAKRLSVVPPPCHCEEACGHPTVIAR